MAWWQRKLLRYALQKTGLLADSYLDDPSVSLDLAFGKRNTLELKRVPLNIPRLAALARIPEHVVIEVAEVQSLKITVPADIYASAIVVEATGIRVEVRLSDSKRQDDNRSKNTKRQTQLKPGEDEVIQTAEQLARSFLAEESSANRQDLQATVAAASWNSSVDESAMSSSTNSSSNSTRGETGTGASIGLPGFLAGFLQGIVNRLQICVKDVEATVEVEPSASEAEPLGLRLRVAEIDLAGLSTESEDTSQYDQDRSDKRQVRVTGITLDLLSGPEASNEIFVDPTRAEFAEGLHTTRDMPDTLLLGRSISSSHDSRDSVLESPPRLASSTAGVTFGSEGPPERKEPQETDLDIQPGDDNLSWASRRSKSHAPSNDLWASVISENDLPKSLMLDRDVTVSNQPGTPRLSRSISPVARRTLQSPGSWPRLDESPPREKHSSPGSWPNLDQSRHFGFQPLTGKLPEDAREEPELFQQSQVLTVLPESMDHGTPQIESPEAGNAPPNTTRHQNSADTLDLTHSRMSASHEEAQSMYMSAIAGVDDGTQLAPAVSTSHSNTAGMAAGTSDEEYQVPGAWGFASATSNAATEAGSRIDTAEIETPRAGSPAPHKEEENFRYTHAKSVLVVDSLVLWYSAAVKERATGKTATPVKSHNETHMPSGRRQQPTPLSFSTYSDLAASRRLHAADVASNLPMQSHQLQNGQQLEIDVGNLVGQLDLAMCKRLHKLALVAAAAFSSDDSSAKQRAAPDAPVLAAVFKAQTLEVVLRHQVDLPHGTAATDPSGTFLTLRCRDIKAEQNADSASYTVGRLEVLLGAEPLCVFNRTSKLQRSIVVTPETPDIAVVHRHSRAERGPHEITVETLPIDLLLDLKNFDDVFGSYGGLSGILEIGSSAILESGLIERPPSPKVARGVRFEGLGTEEHTVAEMKLNARFGGLTATLRAKACSIQLQTTTIKCVRRDQGAVATVEQSLITGPYTDGATESALWVDMLGLRMEYMLTPQDADLERLLALLTPSKDKYDDDQDILVDTLLRQRRKGAVMRITVGNLDSGCDDLARLKPLEALSTELSKLSVVAKYLPEDDRPGILNLIRVKTAMVKSPINERFGVLRLRFDDLHCAHVSLPALLAVSVGSVEVSRVSSNSPEDLIIHGLAPQLQDGLPALMIRTLGDELEPTIKIKVFRLCAEYSVPLVAALTGMPEDALLDDMLNDMVKSVANLAMRSELNAEANLSPGYVSSPPPVPSRRKKIDLLVRESAIMLNPEKLRAKGLLLLNDARLATVAPPEDVITAKLDLRKAAVLLAHNTGSNHDPHARSTAAKPATHARITSALAEQGFVSVGSIMSTSFDVRVERDVESQETFVDVEAKSELLLLETCADSTQTLFAVLGGLAPPMPPSKKPQYLNEPITIEEMIASFTGEVMPQVQKYTAETLFDVEETTGDEDEQDAEDMMDLQAFDDAPGLDAILAGSAMTSSIYAPMSGLLNEPTDDDDPPERPEDYAAAAASLLEDDPFVMPLSPTEHASLSDAALVRELNKQACPTLKEDPLDLGSYLIDDLGYDALGCNILGTQWRFNTPLVGGRRKGRNDKAVRLPFRLKLRESHVIWNIHDGYDWQQTRNGITQAVEQVEHRIEERRAKRHQQSAEHAEDDESAIGDFLFNSIYIGVPSNNHSLDLRRQINRHIDDGVSETESIPVSGISRPATAQSTSGGRSRPQKPRRRLKLERSRTHKIAFELKGVSADVVMFPHDSDDLVNGVDIRVRDFEIFDNVPTSTWRKFLTSNVAERELCAPMIHLDIKTVRTLENYAASEMVVRATVLPLRLHVDQDALDFIARFFEFKESSDAANAPPSDQPFLQRVEIDTVELTLDYKPKKLDLVGLRSGHTTEFMNLIILDGARIRLNHAIVYGLRGFAPLHKTLNDVWMPDIQRNQLPTILAGLAPVRSFVNLAAGVRDVITIPIQEYRKDGRIVRSVHKGATQFGRTTASEIARFGAKVALGSHNLLQNAEGLISKVAGPSATAVDVEFDSDDEDIGPSGTVQRHVSTYASPPPSLSSGLRAAARHLEHDLLTARDAIIAVQADVLEARSGLEAAGAIARGAPTVLLRPVMGGLRGIGDVLLGVGNSVDKEGLARAGGKWKKR